MANVDTIDITKLILVEQGSTPSTPAAGKDKLFVRSSDHLLCLVDSSGTVTPYGGALVNPMTTSQDIIVGGTAGAPARLAKGAAGGVLGLSNGSLAYLAGTSFPGSPATNDRYFRTDRGLEYYYDGTRWLTTTLYSVSFPETVLTFTIAQNAGRMPPPFLGTYSLYLDSWDWFLVAGGTYSGTVYWTCKINWADVNDADTQVGSTTLDTKSDTGGAGKNYTHHGSLATALNASAVEIKLRVDPVGGAAALTYCTGVLNYRMIG